jgi:hypothetical protein
MEEEEKKYSWMNKYLKEAAGFFTDPKRSVVTSGVRDLNRIDKNISLFLNVLNGNDPDRRNDILEREKRLNNRAEEIPITNLDVLGAGVIAKGITNPIKAFKNVAGDITKPKDFIKWLTSIPKKSIQTPAEMAGIKQSITEKISDMAILGINSYIKTDNDGNIAMSFRFGDPNVPEYSVDIPKFYAPMILPAMTKKTIEEISALNRLEKNAPEIIRNKVTSPDNIGANDNTTAEERKKELLNNTRNNIIANNVIEAAKSMSYAGGIPYGNYARATAGGIAKLGQEGVHQLGDITGFNKLTGIGYNKAPILTEAKKAREAGSAVSRDLWFDRILGLKPHLPPSDTDVENRVLGKMDLYLRSPDQIAAKSIHDRNVNNVSATSWQNLPYEELQKQARASINISDVSDKVKTDRFKELADAPYKKFDEQNKLKRNVRDEYLQIEDKGDFIWEDNDNKDNNDFIWE